MVFFSSLGLFENDSASIRCRVHSSNMLKEREREAAGLVSCRKWRLLGDLVNPVIPHKIKPAMSQILRRHHYPLCQFGEYQIL